MDIAAGNASRPAIFILISCLLILMLVTFYDMFPSAPKTQPSDITASASTDPRAKTRATQIRSSVAVILVGLVTAFLPSMKEIRDLATTMPGAKTVVAYVLGLLGGFLFIPRSYLDTYYYIWDPLILFSAAAVFLRNGSKVVTSNKPSTPSILPRVQSLIILVSYLVGVLAFFLVRPGGERAEVYTGTPLFLSILVGFFGLLYVILWVTLPGIGREPSPSTTFLASYSGLIWAMVLSVFAIAVGVTPYFTDDSVKISSVLIYAFLASVLWAASIGAGLPKTIDTVEFGKKQMAWLVLFGLVGLALFVYWAVYSISHLTGAGSYIAFVINAAVIFGLVGYIYKSVRENMPVSKQPPSPLQVLITESIFYVPCVIQDAAQMTVAWAREQSKVYQPTQLYVLITAVSLFALYYWSPRLLNQWNIQGGNQLIQEPQNISAPQVLGTYATLNPDPDTFLYRNALSFWLFIDANSPATSSSYTDYANIVSFGDNPAIEYNTSMRQLRIAIKEGPAVDKMRVIYETHDFPLQRWNHVVINNSGGTMDIFINNVLACSEVNVVPYHKRDAIVVGQPNGINGGICNFVYFTRSLDTYQMYFLHELVQWKTPPVFTTANISIDE